MTARKGMLPYSSRVGLGA